MDGITGHMMDTILRWTFREWIFWFRERTTDGKPRLYQEVEVWFVRCSLLFCISRWEGGFIFGTKPPDTTAWGVLLFSFTYPSISFTLFFFDLLPLLFYSLFYWKKGENSNYRFLDHLSFHTSLSLPLLPSKNRRMH